MFILTVSSTLGDIAILAADLTGKTAKTAKTATVVATELASKASAFIHSEETANKVSAIKDKAHSSVESVGSPLSNFGGKATSLMASKMKKSNKTKNKVTKNP